jgi:hypothetical protein
VADLLTDIRRDIARRLDELRPVRDEFRRLERARDALSTANAARHPARASKANAGSTGTRMTRAQSQEIDKQVLALLAEDSAQRPAALATLTETRQLLLTITRKEVLGHNPIVSTDPDDTAPFVQQPPRTAEATTSAAEAPAKSSHASACSAFAATTA